MPDVFISSDENVQEITSPILQKNIPETESQKSSFKGHSHNRFAAFNLYPDHVNFETKEDDEKIILLLRQHPIVNVNWIVISFILFVIPSFLTKFGVTDLLPSGYMLVFSLIWYLVTSTYALEGFLTWYFNVYFITTQRVIDVDFFNLIDKRVSDAHIEKIQDVSYTTKGVLGAAFNYGDVIIQTASEIPEFDFLRVPDPDRVVKILDELRDKYK
jgi:hypothetical protein